MDDPFLDELLSFLDTPVGDPLPPSAIQHVSDTSDSSHSLSAATSTDDSSSSDGKSECSSPPPAQYSPLEATRRIAFTQTKRPQPKRTLDLLRAEAIQLTDELHRLRWHVAHSHSHAMDMAITERIKRRRAEEECQQLRDALYAQTRFIRGLRSVFSSPSCGVSSFNLSRYLHKYTRLPREMTTRSNEYAGLAEETRLLTARNILMQETESISSLDGDGEFKASLNEPYIQTELVTDLDGFGVTTTSVFAVDTNDLESVLRGVFVAIGEIVVKCQSYRCTQLNKHVVDPRVAFGPGLVPTPSQSNILYRVMGVRHQSLQDDDELTVESRTVTLYKQTGDEAVVLWDFIDDDELHPIKESTDIARQATGACLLRREICEDGVERVVYRSLSSRQYRYQSRSNSDVLTRFFNATTRTMRENELIFRGIMSSAIIAEQKAHAAALEAFRAV